MPSEIRVKNRLQTWVRFRLIRTVPNRVSSCWRAGQAWNDPVTTALTDPTADDVDAGNVIPNAGPTFTIKANRSWTLKIKSQNATNWTYSGSFVGVKPIGDLAWSTAVGGTFAAITNTDATFTSGASSSNGAAAQVFFRTSWTADYTSASNLPGTYSLPIVFTLTAP
jgi:hypothetical protein